MRTFAAIINKASERKYALYFCCCAVDLFVYLFTTQLGCKLYAKRDNSPVFSCFFSAFYL